MTFLVGLVIGLCAGFIIGIFAILYITDRD